MARYSKADNDETYGDRPPMVKETLEKEITRLRQKLRGKFPGEISRDHAQAALWWMSKQKPANDNTERPRQIPVSGSQTRWVNPYADRLVSSLRAFCQLTPQQRDFVMAAEEDGVWYNGDSFDFFHKVYEQSMLMRSMGAKKYREGAIKQLKKLIAGMHR